MKCPKCLAENPSDTRFCGHCASPLIPGSGAGTDGIPGDGTKTMATPADGASVGLAFAGRYYLIEELGEGGMGRVFLAQDKELEDQIPAPVSRAIMKCLEKDRDRRYANAGELIAELRAIEKEISATRPVRTLTGGWTTKSIRRPAVLKRYAVPALVLAACFLTWFFAIRRPSSEKPSAFTSMIPAKDQPQKKSVAAEESQLKPAPTGGPPPTEKKAEEKPNVVKAAPKEAPKAAEPAPPEKPKIDLDALMKAGREAYQKGDYDQCLQAMAEVLKVIPGEAAARSLQADAEEKKKLNRPSGISRPSSRTLSGLLTKGRCRPSTGIERLKILPGRSRRTSSS